MNAITRKPKAEKAVAASAPKRSRPKAATLASVEAIIADANGPKKGDALRNLIIAAPNFVTAKVKIIGTTPLVLHKFSEKAKQTIKATQEAGSQGRKGKTREARDFQANFQAARHISTEGWDGFPASAVRNALISACRTVGFKMTLAKLSLFCVADGFSEDGTPLVRITKGRPTCDIRAARNSNGGTDLRARPMWQPGWEATLTLEFDGDQFSGNDVGNLLARAGRQVGLGEGRPDSHLSAGVGWGEFRIAQAA